MSKIGNKPVTSASAHAPSGKTTAAKSSAPKTTKKPKAGEASESQASAGKKGAAFIGAASQPTTQASGASQKANALLTGAKPKVPAEPGALVQGQKAKDKKVTEVFFTPTSRTSTTVRYIMPNHSGKEITPGERWLFEVPEDLRGANIRTVILAHRKDSKYAASVKGKYDNEGAYNLVTARNAKTGDWVTWSDQYGSKKFAEPRSSGDPENENLHDWLDSVGEVAVDLVSVTNVGSGKNAVANVHFLEIEFFPAGKVTGKIEKIFTPGTKFVNPEKGITEPSYGGGMGGHLSDSVLKTKGLYPDSVKIGSWGSDNAEIDENISLKGGRLHIKLPEGKKLGGLEVAVGDTVFDKNRPASEQTNQDGHYGTLGFAKLSARLQNSQGATGSSYGKAFMERMNVPPSGVLSGGPVDVGYVTKAGDEIVIDASSNAWVMGLRVQFVK